VYSAGSNGDAKPVAAITGKNIYVGDVALDASGRIYTTNGKNSINVYKAGSISSAPPIASLPNPGVNLYPGGFAVDAGGKIYLTSTEMHHGGSSNKVVVYPAAVNGADTTPVATITSDSIQTYFLTGIAVGPDGKIYVALGLGSRIEVFPPASNGNVKTIATITSTATGITEPHGIAVGADGKIYIVNKEVTPHSCGSLLVFARDSYGDVPPIATIVGPHTGLQNPNGVAVDRTGNVYVINQVGVQQCGPHHSTVADIDPSTRFAPITAYSAAAIASGGGDVKPVAGIDGLDSGFYTSTSIAVDSRGRVYTTVWQPNQVIIYPSGANGDAAPAATITGDQTRLDNPVAVALDSKGNIYVANRGGGLNFTAKTEPSINVYPPDSNGNAKPIAIIEGEKTGLVNDAISLAVNGSGTLCAANPFRINVFSLDANGNVAPIATITGPKMIGATGQLTGIAIGPAAP
jgi:sugar lactone lactonase YvrE